MPNDIRGLVVKIAERCNLNCSYCYMYNHVDRSYLSRPHFMCEETFSHLLTRIEQYWATRPGKKMTIIFHGGEPMLMDPDQFDRMASAARERLLDRLSMGLQSNGTLVTSRWIEVLRRNGVRVGVSIDGPPEIHDRVRVDHQGRGSHAQVVKGLERLRQGEVLSGTLTVVNPGQSGLDTYRYLRSLGIQSMDFLIPDVTHDSRSSFYPGHGATPVADYLLPIFDTWLEEDDPDVQIRLFISIIRKILGGETQSEAIGNRPESYLVIDTDGSIQANDVLKVCGTGLSESGLSVARHGFEDLESGLPLVNRLVNQGVPLCKKCQACPESEVCGGGAVPNRYSKQKEFDNPSVWCEDLLKLTNHIRTRIRYELAA